MRIAVVDGQGGGIGRALIEKIRIEIGNEADIIALGTNALATASMLKSGANEGATGENAIAYNASRVDIIMGAIGIIAANSMLGELTPAMAKAVCDSSARKILIPLNKCSIQVAGVKNEPLPVHIDSSVTILKGLINSK